MKVWKIPCNTEFKVTYPFGVFDENLNWYNADKRHHGTDMVITDDIVYSASGSGVVTFAGWNNQGYGNLVMVQMDRFTFYYAHLKEIYVKRGDNVDYSTKIGVQGATGNVTGKHLHFEVRKDRCVIDSAQYMGIPNELGVFYPWDYGFEIDENDHIDTTRPTKYQKGQLVVYSTYYYDKDSNVPIDCIQNHGSWLQDYIEHVEPGHSQPYRLVNGRWLNDGDIREVK